MINHHIFMPPFWTCLTPPIFPNLDDSRIPWTIALARHHCWTWWQSASQYPMVTPSFDGLDEERHLPNQDSGSGANTETASTPWLSNSSALWAAPSLHRHLKHDDSQTWETRMANVMVFLSFFLKSSYFLCCSLVSAATYLKHDDSKTGLDQGTGANGWCFSILPPTRLSHTCQIKLSPAITYIDILS